MLRQDQIKCPSCGAPTGRGGRRADRRSAKLTVAAYMLLVFAVVAGVYGAVLLYTPATLAGDTTPVDLGSATLSTLVRHDDGSPAANATVTVDAGRFNATTGADGAATFHGVPWGHRRVTFELENHTTVVYRVFIQQDLTVEAVLNPGEGSVVLNHASFDDSLWTFRICGGFLLAFVLLFVAAGVACLRRRAYGLVLSGAWLSLPVMFVLLTPVTLMGIIAIVLVMRSKIEFRSAA
jgi:hypothetical protein